jgi:hypothetical protein
MTPIWKHFIFTIYCSDIKCYGKNIKMVTSCLPKENLKTGKREYLDHRNEKTEKISEQFRSSKQQIKERLENLKEKLKRDEKLNKIEGIARAPKELVITLISVCFLKLILLNIKSYNLIQK